MVYTPKTIYCPRCGRKVATHDGRSTMNISVECRKCHKKVVFLSGEWKNRIKISSVSCNIQRNDLYLGEKNEK